MSRVQSTEDYFAMLLVAYPVTDYVVFNISHENYRSYLVLDLSKRKAKFYGQDNNNFLSVPEI